MVRQMEKTAIAMRYVLARIMLGGTVLCIVWSIVYYFILLLIAGITVPFVHALIYGLYIGAILSLFNSIAILLISGGKSYSQTSINISAGIMMIPIAIISLLFSPSLIYVLMHPIMGTLGSKYVTEYALSSSKTHK